MFTIPAKIKVSFLGSLALGYILLLFAFGQIPDNKFHIYFLDVGQGDAIFIKTPENHQILVDGGPRNAVLEELSEIMPFFDKSIDLMILTHPHADHIGGLVEVMKKYEVGNVLFTGVNYENFYYDEFLRSVREEGAQIFIAENATDFLLGKVKIDVIFPEKQIAFKNIKDLNDSSAAMRIEYENRSILLMGDLSAKVEAELLKDNIWLESDILKAGHHGSRDSSSIEFLNKVKPEVVVTQSGKGNSFGHPHYETLERFEETGVREIYRNDLDGRIEFIF